MPRRKIETQTEKENRTQPKKENPTTTYWETALQKLGLLSPITTEATLTSATQIGITGWELQIIKDPLFDKFLRYGPGRSGIGPKTVGEFLELPEEDKKFYAKVFQEWKKVIKERNIPIEQLE